MNFNKISVARGNTAATALHGMGLPLIARKAQCLKILNRSFAILGQV